MNVLELKMCALPLANFCSCNKNLFLPKLLLNKSKQYRNIALHASSGDQARPNFHYNQDYLHLESFSELFYNTQILTNYI